MAGTASLLALLNGAGPSQSIAVSDLFSQPQAASTASQVESGKSKQVHGALGPSSDHEGLAAASSHFAQMTLDDVLDDLSSRFIVNLPAEELLSVERICFQVEQAHWFYEDFVRPQQPALPSFDLRHFTTVLFQACPLLAQYDAEEAYTNFLRYRKRVPVCGSIMLNPHCDKVLLVKGWTSGSTFSFPRGKINQGESERDCAIREIWEETGYDLRPHIDASIAPHPQSSIACPPPLPEGIRDKDYVEITMQEQRIRLYVIAGIPEDFAFETRTRKEISSIKWFALTQLPAWSEETKKTDKKFYMVAPFIKPLKRYLKARKAPRRNEKPAITILQKPTPSEATLPMPAFSDLEEGNRALQALFFGTSEASPALLRSKDPPQRQPVALTAHSSPASNRPEPPTETDLEDAAELPEPVDSASAKWLEQATAYIHPRDGSVAAPQPSLPPVQRDALLRLLAAEEPPPSAPASAIKVNVADLFNGANPAQISSSKPPVRTARLPSQSFATEQERDLKRAELLRDLDILMPVPAETSRSVAKQAPMAPSEPPRHLRPETQRPVLFTPSAPTQSQLVSPAQPVIGLPPAYPQLGVIPGQRPPQNGQNGYVPIRQTSNPNARQLPPIPGNQLAWQVPPPSNQMISYVNGLMRPLPHQAAILPPPPPPQQQQSHQQIPLNKQKPPMQSQRPHMQANQEPQSYAFQRSPQHLAGQQMSPQQVSPQPRSNPNAPSLLSLLNAPKPAPVPAPTASAASAQAVNASALLSLFDRAPPGILADATRPVYPSGSPAVAAMQSSRPDLLSILSPQTKL
ncbi:uncharacterized protein L969DRAFT_17040 [Mixia osmundae IAM 14324]|uniref:Nudix hydrolase domain-containing protein n=1 Tax=Mixia osmundae (strain CBS 9802 / IAM 14324 / JCM 22182 / KY 12970) TaxID=764103 RepID=G7E6J8_MIXOS|nr:uncharacterized protein L969DRAFT_17040 [Mixia osmundae IAM 14324]KEI40384.1 hypothetical protein L969DRAFT_17040 [Mixia osmundae IAM 14324]GAA98458.1 hypothetical protein E5Q_05144 [Mixia osmundae IAM 14324]